MSIRINGSEISDKQINLESAHHHGRDPREAQRRAAVALAVRELLLQRVDELKIARDNGEDSAIEALIEHEVEVPEADEESCRRFYGANLESFTTPVLVEARHILLAAHPEDLQEREEVRASAEALIERLRMGADFAGLAAGYSACPSKEQGGNLGQISRGQTVPEFEDALLRLPVGLAERPLESRYGFHIVEVVHRVEGQVLPFEAVREQIRGYLQEKAQRQALNHYLRRLAAEAEIEGIEFDVDASPLMQ